MTERFSILVKTRGAAKRTGFQLESGASRLTVGEPLFASIETVAAEEGKRSVTARTAEWRRAEFEAPTGNAWDACHALAEGSKGFSGGAGLEFAEPDLENTFDWTSPSADLFALKDKCGSAKPQKRNPYEAVPGNDFWFLADEYSSLAKARGLAKAKGRAGGRIAHVDTGYDPGHISLPENLLTGLQRNFRDPDDHEDAVDRRAEQVLANLGHGTGTLAILAGRDIRLSDKLEQVSGGADLEVVPIRVANWVVQFRTSALAKAFDYIHSLKDDPSKRCDVVTLSLGGVASGAWADAVNALYDAGILVVAAAGNNYGNLPARSLVYPARFDRVLAACGVMAGGTPYADLPGGVMQGCYGPRARMQQAMAAYTPNLPWARFGCSDLFDRDGGGTSCATPQIASAAALWMNEHQKDLAAFKGKDAWKRVELAREALYRGARGPGANTEKLGRGILNAAETLKHKPAGLTPAIRYLPPERVSFPLLRVLTGLGLSESQSSRAHMLELEAVQLSQKSSEIEALMERAEPEAASPAVSAGTFRVLEALADQPGASRALKAVIRQQLGSGRPGPARPLRNAGAGALQQPAFVDRTPARPAPERRRLAIYASDPLTGTRFEDFHLNTAATHIRWEADLRPGPVGEYVEVVDVDPGSGAVYMPVDLNDPALLANDGFAPTEGHPQFHQQMVYAVSMRTIELFEKALGRRAQWPERLSVAGGEGGSGTFGGRFVRRLRIYPHALREANAYYSPARGALLFGYFQAEKNTDGELLPGGTVFTCLSHDIIAHEVAHALVDGLHPRYNEASNPDILAFHEAFSDIIALFQHFTIPDALRDQIMRHRGDLSLSTMLGALALQFGQAIGHRGALRNAIVEMGEDGKWQRKKPRKDDYLRHDAPHMRGQVLVGAVFEAFINVYEREARDFIRLATGGSGVLPPGEISSVLAGKLSEVAAKVADRIITICIRALDYCPPVDLTFGEYLRALITADRDISPSDPCGYRVAFVSAFRARGIYPESVANLSEDTLTWQGPYHDLSELDLLLSALKVDWDLNSDRLHAYLSSRDNAAALARSLGALPARVFDELGLVSTPGNGRTEKVIIDGIRGSVSRIEVHSVRPATRVAPSGQIRRELVVELTQTWIPDGQGQEAYRGGATIIFEADKGQTKFVIRKRTGHPRRTAVEQSFRSRSRFQNPALNYARDRGLGTEPFGLLHRD